VSTVLTTKQTPFLFFLVKL